jgi:glutamate N-acetyltransferase/amino-acid N-acetyltransferase
MDKIKAGIRDSYALLDSAPASWDNASRAIMTTDTVPKLFSRTFAVPTAVGSRELTACTIAGMVKGAGMIHPNMATMLGVMVTDASISPAALEAAIRYASDRSFNCISIDGDTSTNDTVAVLANGRAFKQHRAGAYVIDDTKSDLYVAFRDALTASAGELAQRLVRDGEGATKFITITVKGARTFQEARHVASSIATSSLVKTAMFGQDANWGRILCAVGYSGADINPDSVNLFFDGKTSADSLQLVKNGRPHDTDEARASALLRETEINVRVELGLGDESATVWTCDFSIDYVKINADYRS